MKLTKYRSILNEQSWRKDANLKDIDEILKLIEELKELTKKPEVNRKLRELIRLIGFFWEENEYGDIDVNYLSESDLPLLKRTRSLINKGSNEISSTNLKDLKKTLEFVRLTMNDYKKQIISYRD